MTDLELEKEMIFVKLIRKGPHVLEFSDDCLMIHNGKLTVATELVRKKYYKAKSTSDKQASMMLEKEIASIINEEYYMNKNLEWYSLRDYISNFTLSRLEEFKKRIS